MRGNILHYSPETGEGLISGADGKRYTFKGTEYHGRVLDIRPGLEVDFEPHDDGTATAVFPLVKPLPAGAGKSKVAAGILAILLGVFGIHKFYLGYTGAGIVMLLVTLCTLFILSPLIGLIAFIEGILYLVKTDEEFEETYVRNKRAWF
jgi:TM2 domain-containing membrane protein YozV